MEDSNDSKIKRMSTVCGGVLATVTALGILTFSQVNGSADTNTTNQSKIAQVNQPTNNVTADNNTSSVAAATNQNTATNTLTVDPNTVASQNIAPTSYAVSLAAAPVTNSYVYNTNPSAVDVSWANPNTNADTFRQLKSQGVNYAIVQLTKGTYMQDAPAQKQINDARAAGMGVAVYHFAKYNSHDSAVAEANFFADRAQQLGLATNTLMIADVEDPINRYAGVANDTRAFFD